MTQLASTSNNGDEPDDGDVEDQRPDQTDESNGLATDASSLPKDVVFGLLSVKRRRQTLKFLDDNNGKGTLSDLAEHIAATENNIEPHQLSSQQRKRVYIGLYQCHLPKMDDADVINFNQARGNIETGPNADQLLRYIKAAPSETETPGERDWPTPSGFVQAVQTLLTNSD